jgi:hypothetical protein
VQRLVKLAKVATLLSAAFTISCALVIFGSQVASWSRTGVWDTHRLSSVVRSLKDDQTYMTASANQSQGKLSSKEAMIDWLLGTPTVAILLIVVAFHFVFYLFLAFLDEEQRNV